MNDPKFITIPQAAAELQVSRRTIQRYVEQGRIRVNRYSTKTVRIERDEFQKFLRARRP